MPKKFISAGLLACLVGFAAGPARALCVDVPKANLRQGPGTQYEKSWEVYRYMPFRKIETRGEWHFVEDMDGDRHWIAASLVKDDLPCAAINARRINLRTGPGAGHTLSPHGPVDKYYTFRVVEIRGDWVRVSDEGIADAWVARRFLWMP